MGNTKEAIRILGSRDRSSSKKIIIILKSNKNYSYFFCSLFLRSSCELLCIELLLVECLQFVFWCASSFLLRSALFCYYLSSVSATHQLVLYILCFSCRFVRFMIQCVRFCVCVWVCAIHS